MPFSSAAPAYEKKMQRKRCHENSSTEMRKKLKRLQLYNYMVVITQMQKSCMRKPLQPKLWVHFLCSESQSVCMSAWEKQGRERQWGREKEQERDGERKKTKRIGTLWIILLKVFPWSMIGIIIRPIHDCQIITMSGVWMESVTCKKAYSHSPVCHSSFFWLWTQDFFTLPLNVPNCAFARHCGPSL